MFKQYFGTQQKTHQESNKKISQTSFFLETKQFKINQKMFDYNVSLFLEKCKTKT